MGSAAKSGVPPRENTNATSRNLLIRFSLANCIACDCDSDVLGIRFTSMTIFFSSRMGTNSCPSRMNRSAAPAIKASAATMTGMGLRTIFARAGPYRAFTPRRSRCSRSWIRSAKAIAIIAGTNVSERTNAEKSAMMTVSAIGRNVFPSTPLKLRSGT